MPPQELLARLTAIVLAQPRTRALPCHPDRNDIARFVQYSRTMHYPDTIDVSQRATGSRLSQSIRAASSAMATSALIALVSSAGLRPSNDRFQPLSALPSHRFAAGLIETWSGLGAASADRDGD
jgi:hypothetical protein